MSGQRGATIGALHVRSCAQSHDASNEVPSVGSVDLARGNMQKEAIIARRIRARGLAAGRRPPRSRRPSTTSVSRSSARLGSGPIASPAVRRSPTSSSSSRPGTSTRAEPRRASVRPCSRHTRAATSGRAPSTCITCVSSTGPSRRTWAIPPGAFAVEVTGAPVPPVSGPVRRATLAERPRMGSAAGTARVPRPRQPLALSLITLALRARSMRTCYDEPCCS